MKTIYLCIYLYYMYRDYIYNRYYEEPEFTLQDFMRKISEEEHVPLEKVQEVHVYNLVNS